MKDILKKPGDFNSLRNPGNPNMPQMDRHDLDKRGGQALFSSAERGDKTHANNRK
jgi:hypothetical protein